jgi:hypothetical protein
MLGAASSVEGFQWFRVPFEQGQGSAEGASICTRDPTDGTTHWQLAWDWISAVVSNPNVAIARMALVVAAVLAAATTSS